MMLSFDFAIHGLQLAALRVASLMIPASDRAEWWQEWHAELWHVRRACIPIGPFSPRAQWEVTSFCLGSFRDAVALRRHASSPVSAANVHGSAGQCILGLAAALVLCIVVAGLLPGVRAKKDSARFQPGPGVLLIQDSRVSASVPGISASTFRTWNQSRQRYFDNLGFYRVARETVAHVTQEHASLRVAHASFNLPTLLGLPVHYAATTGDRDDLPRVILGHEAWKRDFGADTHIAGSIVRIGGREARVAGVAAYGSWRLPGRPDAWLLESNSTLASGEEPGYVLAHLSALGFASMSGDHIYISQPGDENDPGLDGFILCQSRPGPWGIFAFSLFLALLSLPAVTSVSMSESSFSSHRPSFKRRILRWMFLASKVALIAAIACFASFILAYWRMEANTDTAEFVQFSSSFVMCLMGFRWALLDQRHRCPVCLRRVTHPAQVGLASRTFLGWNGTEMICMGGHTLLHVPSLPTSWFSNQRWMYLDTSWEFLFAGAGAP